MHVADPNPTQTIDGILSPRTVEKTVALDTTTIWRMRQRGLFPQPVKLSPGRVGYRRSDIEQWLESRKVASVARG